MGISWGPIPAVPQRKLRSSNVCLLASETRFLPCSGLRSNVRLWLSVVHVDYVKGFGGKFGVQTDRQDKCALGWDHQEKLQLHESQKGTSSSPALQLSSGAFGKLVFIPWLVTCLTSAVFLSEFRFHGVKLPVSPPIPEVSIVDGDKVIPSYPHSLCLCCSHWEPGSCSTHRGLLPSGFTFLRWAMVYGGHTSFCGAGDGTCGFIYAEQTLPLNLSSSNPYHTSFVMGTVFLSQWELCPRESWFEEGNTLVAVPSCPSITGSGLVTLLLSLSCRHPRKDPAGKP